MTMIEPEPFQRPRFGAAPEQPPSLRREAPLPIPPGNLFRRLLTARVVADVLKARPSEIAAFLWPQDKLTGQLLARAASAPAMTSVTGWAAELAQKVVRDAMQALGAASCGAAILGEGLVLAWDGAALISAPGFVADANMAGFVAEGNPIPVHQLTVGPAQLQPHKIASIAVLTREMIESSNAEVLVGDALIRAAALALDAALFDSTAETATRPAGLRQGVAATPASTATDPFEQFLADVMNLVNATSAVGGNGPYCLITSPGRAIQMLIRMVRDLDMIAVLGSNAVGNDMICCAAAALVSAFELVPEIETSNATTLHMNDVPAAIVNGGAPASPQRSMFQTDSIAVKMRWQLSWARRDIRAVAWTTPSW